MLSSVFTYASVLEVFKGKSQEVRDLALKSSKTSGKPITHYSLCAAEQLLLRVENSVEVQPELYDKLMHDIGFGPGKPPRLSLSSSQSCSGSKPRSLDVKGSAATSAAPAYGKQAKMAWDAYQALLKVLQLAAKPILVEVSLTGAEIRAALDRWAGPAPKMSLSACPP